MPQLEWTGGDLPTFVTHLECRLTGERYEADRLQGLSRAGRPLLVRYDLDGVRRALSREALASRPQTLWRYRELLPVRRPENVLSLGEVVTPIVSLPRLAAAETTSTSFCNRCAVTIFAAILNCSKCSAP